MQIYEHLTIIYSWCTKIPTFAANITIMIDLFIQIRVVDIIDITLVAALLYGLYSLVKGTSATSIFLGIVAIWLIWQVVKALQMELLSSILGAFVSVGFIALIIIFQPEIRRFLFTIGTQARKNKLSKKFHLFRLHSNSIILDAEALTQACLNMSDIKQGALIIVTKQNQLDDIALTGVDINANISNSLIENIFFKNSPLHDGAMIISHGRIQSAGCILPVSHNLNIPKELGLRHRAALGMSQESDALVVIVSEENGGISVARNGEFKLRLSAEELERILTEDL